MPGTTGNELALRLRALCGPATTLLAMSASVPDDNSSRDFDGFLLKPFAMDALTATIARTDAAKSPDGATAVVLDESVLRQTRRIHATPPVRGVVCPLSFDAEARVVGMRHAASSGDDAAYRRAAHAIKGSCGMVGALELQILATSMEERGLSDDHVASLNEFVRACERLRDMLVAHRNHS